MTRAAAALVNALAWLADRALATEWVGRVLDGMDAAAMRQSNDLSADLEGEL